MQAGNYIHQLQMTVREQAQALTEIRETYMDLVRYLMSEKFQDDPTVQVRDVLNRLQPIHFSTMGPAPQLVQKLTQPVIATGEITSL